MQTPEKLEWVPYKFQRMKGSAAYRLPSSSNPAGLWDFQFAWYWKAITEALDSDNAGCLPNDVDQLWKLCGARTKSFFVQNGGTNMIERYFPGVTPDGKYRYRPQLLQLIRLQLTKKNGYQSVNESPDLFLDDLSLSSKKISLNLIKPEELRAITKRLFAYYIATFRRDNRYKLTPMRAKKCELRILEVFEECGSLETAEKRAIEAIDRLAASEFHVSGGYYDWIAQLFKSTEEFQKRLTMPVQVDPKEARIRAEAAVGASNGGSSGKNHWRCPGCHVVISEGQEKCEKCGGEFEWE